MRLLQIVAPLLLGCLLIAGLSCSSLSDATPAYDFIIRNGYVLDGSGNPWFRADIAVRGDRIAAVGHLTNASARQEIDATGYYVTPGFIDAHSHAGTALDDPERSPAQPLLAQGITTVFINPDGGGAVDLVAQRAALLRDSLGVNVGQLVPHGSVRAAVIGMADRLATDAELDSMRHLVRQGMEAGAFGLSSGPFYAPGSFSDTRELVELAKVAAEYGGVYTSHIRDESNYSIGLEAAVEEVITVARDAGLPGIVTHIKALGPPVWGLSDTLVARIEQARAAGISVYADQYAYTASATGLEAALVPRWAQAGGSDALLARLQDPTDTARIRAAMIENLARRGGADRIQFRRVAQDATLEGRLLSDAAREAGLDPVRFSADLIRRGAPFPDIISYNQTEADVETFMRQPWTMTCTDGALPRWGEGVPHPRGFGAFTRKLAYYVRERKTIDLPFAIRSMTSLPAQVFGLTDRGTLRVGARADILIFDPAQVQHRGTFTDPFHLAEGMEYVFVNGQAAVWAGAFTGALAGRVLAHSR
jgi:N-acyl-D-aspartate/D-glutamate deacylase